MEFDVYCDESAIEALSKENEHSYTGIGSIWIPKEFREKFKEDIKQIKEKYGYRHEFKWQKVSPSSVEFYKELVDYFFSRRELRFRVILIESDKIDHKRYNHRDPELGFYKFYYQLIKHWILDFNEYYIFTDLKINRDKGRLKTLREFLSKVNLFSEIKQLQALRSKESYGIQLADMLTGLVTSKFNEHFAVDGAKHQVISYLEKKHLKSTIAPTLRWEEKFNVFKINLEGGW